MTLFNELKRYEKSAENSDTVRDFKAFLNIKYKENKLLFQQYEADPSDNKLVTILGYLIRHHEEIVDKSAGIAGKNLWPLIEVVMKRMPNINAGHPFHQAIREGKLTLATKMLGVLEDSSKGDADELRLPLNYDARDEQGRTLLSVALDAWDFSLSELIINKVGDIHQPSNCALDDHSSELIPPLHQAIRGNMPEIVTQLLKRGAQMDLACGSKKNTPILEATESGNVLILDTLLKLKFFAHEKQQHLETRNHKGSTAVGVACEKLRFSKNDQERDTALMALAMLFCHGAQVPQLDLMKNLLIDSRKALLSKMGDYLHANPELVKQTVRTCHDKNSSLHEIFYVTTTSGRMFGQADNTAEEIEGWILKNDESDRALDTQKEADDGDLRKFAEFVRDYHKTYADKLFSNPWSSMRWKLARGQITNWSDVERYAKEHEGSRTSRVVYLMNQSVQDPDPHLDETPSV